MGRRSGLGKGLGALIPAAEDPDSELRELPVSAIRANEFQPRAQFDDDAMATLTSSVAELGVLQPILVRPVGDHFELIAGERRWRAAQQAGLATVPAIVRVVEDHLSLAQALVENVQREDLNAIEEAVAYQQLVDDFGLDAEEIGTRVGKSRSAVANTLRLLALPEAIQDLVRSRTLSAGHARALLAIDDPVLQHRLATRAVGEQLSVRALEEAVRQALAGGETPPRRAAPEKSAGVLEIEERLSDSLATRVEVQRRRNGRGQIVVHFAGDEDLQRLYDALGRDGQVD